MENFGNLKKCNKNKNSKINRIISLFEIPRPNKTRGLLRTNSLPSTSTKTDNDNKTRRLLKSYSNGENKVQKIKEEIEQRSRKGKDNVTLTPKSVKKKVEKQAKEEQLRKHWLADKEKIMEDINKLQEKIEDVTEEIQNSDTELEITIKDNGEDEVFENEVILRGELSDKDSETNNFNRLSVDTVLYRVSTDSMEEEKMDYESSICVNLVYRRSLSAEPDYFYENSQENANITIENDKESETNKKNDGANYYKEVENNEEPENIEETENSKEPSKNNEDTSSYKEEERGDQETESDENSITINELFQSLSNDENNSTEPDSIDWWKHKSFVQINQENSLENDEESEINQNSEAPFTGRFIKNNRSRRNKHIIDRRRTGILQKPLSVKELTKRFDGFQDAADKGETENYRKSFIEEMDKEIENMRNDGFTEDFHLSFENLTLLCDNDGTKDEANEEINGKTEYEETSPLFQTIIIFPNQEEHLEQYEHLDQDLFGENYFSEDLENGLYYLEAYNADGKELIMCSVQVERQSVDLNSFDEMKASSNTQFISNDKSMLVMMEEFDAPKSGTDSKRTTIYSTTSGESFEDEGIEDIENSSKSYEYGTSARRETYCDDQGIVRIERVAPYLSEEYQDYKTTINNYYYPSQEKEEGVSDVVKEENYYEFVQHPEEISEEDEEIASAKATEVKKGKLQYILDEIKSTERKFVSDIQKVLKEYKTFLEERCPEKVDVVFANMEQIYQGQLQFLDALEACDLDIIEVAQAFIDFEDLFRLYPRYFKNTPKANVAVKDLSFLIKEKQDMINDKLHLSAYLLTPLQRLGKYKLFLENIIKQLEKEGQSIVAIQMALDIIKKYMSKGNDAVAVASILFSPLHTREYGAFISREKFSLLKPKRLEVMVFLFEAVIVFTTEDQKNMEQFIYHQSIKTNDLRIATYDDTTIHLTDYTKTKRRNSTKYTYVLDAKSHKLKIIWKQQIEEILWKQMKKIKEKTLKEYQSGNKRQQSNKKPTEGREYRLKSTGNKPTGLFGFSAFLYK